MSMLPFCRFCGERHPLLQCPELDEVERGRAKAAVVKPVVAPIIAAAQMRNGGPVGPPCVVAVATVAPSFAAPMGKGRCLESLRHQALTATQPWKAAGMSRATWFRRRLLASQPPLIAPASHGAGV